MEEEVFNGSHQDMESDQELVREVSIVIDKGQEAVRIDKFLCSRVERISRTKFQAAADAKSLIVNGKPVKSSYKVQPGDHIHVLIPRPFGYEGIEPEDIPLNIIHEDSDLIIINKPAGLVVHPGVGNFTGTLVNALLFHVKDLVKTNDALKPGIVHRLDKETSGVMVIAKNEYALAFLAKQFFEKTNERKYLTLVWGDVEGDTGTIDKPIARHQTDRKKMHAYEPFENENAKHSVTHYKVIERFGYATLIECVLETGRTHQIRVHMASIGHPVFNDKRYGGNVIVKGTIFSKYKQFVENCFKVCPRQALHAKILGIEHPTHKEFIRFDSELPSDMSDLIEKWRSYSKGRLENYI
jgi:23S rRNA pseudouridine1911/1915/1917 synthase